MACSEIRILIGGLAHLSILFLTNFIKGKFGIKTEEVTDDGVYEELIKIIEVKDTVVKEERVEAIKKLSNKQDNIEQRVDEIYEKVKKKKIRGRKKE
tara:strand:- start:237 stop:527 length:291 start_codon:yes stop_codon:yes gene_type:complete